MIYVRFSGRTPIHATDYVSYMVFDAGTTRDQIKQFSKDCAIQNANNFWWRYEATLDTKHMSVEEYNQVMQDYVSACIDYSSYQFLTEKDFNDELDSL